MRDDDKILRRRRRGGWLALAVIALGLVAAAILWPMVPPESEARFVYLVLFAVFLGVGLVWALGRMPLSRGLRHGAMWLLIGAIPFVGYSFRDEARYVFDRVAGDLYPQRGYGATATQISFRAGPGGHFVVNARVQGVRIPFLIDTGASDVVLTPADARRLGFDPQALDYSRVYQTANGVVMGAPITLREIRVGPVVVKDVSATVNEAPMDHSLLGMSFLSRTGGYRVGGDTLTLYVH